MEYADAKQTDYVGFLHRHPFATDAYELGFATGVREDYQLFPGGHPPNVDVPVVILDNDFEDPDVDRYLGRFDRYDPSVAIIGDAYTPSEAVELNAVVDDLRSEHPHKEYVIVPKCPGAFEQLDDDIVLGYPLGYSDLDAWEYSDARDWRGRKVHVLGASPPKQYATIEELTQPNLTGDPPADIVGVDWNGPQKVAYRGEYWSRDGWQPADQLTIRETVRKSLEEIKQYWQENRVWPETEPRQLHGPAVREPDELIFMDRGGDPIATREDLEEAYVREYEEHGTLAFRDESRRSHWEYYEGLEIVESG